jgi:hypothetical protein
MESNDRRSERLRDATQRHEDIAHRLKWISTRLTHLRSQIDAPDGERRQVVDAGVGPSQPAA